MGGPLHRLVVPPPTALALGGRHSTYGGIDLSDRSTVRFTVRGGAAAEPLRRNPTRSPLSLARPLAPRTRSPARPPASCAQRFIGEGGQACIFEGFCNGRRRALKVFVHRGSEDDIAGAKAEIFAYQRLRARSARNVLQTDMPLLHNFEVEGDEEEMIILPMELCDYDLYDWIMDVGAFGEVTSRHVFRILVEGACPCIDLHCTKQVARSGASDGTPGPSSGGLDADG